MLGGAWESCSGSLVRNRGPVVSIPLLEGLAARRQRLPILMVRMLRLSFMECAYAQLGEDIVVSLWRVWVTSQSTLNDG
jgi:hypothetical protein